MRKLAVVIVGGLCAALSGCQTLGWPSSRTLYGADVLQTLEAEPQPVVAELPPPPAMPEPPPPAPAPQPAPAYAAAPAPTPAPAPAPARYEAPRPAPAPAAQTASAAPSGDKRMHTVKSGETLQKISQTYYGTTRKWMRIYEANKNVLKSPDHIVEKMKLVIPS